MTEILTDTSDLQSVSFECMFRVRELRNDERKSKVWKSRSVIF